MQTFPRTILSLVGVIIAGLLFATSAMAQTPAVTPTDATAVSLANAAVATNELTTEQFQAIAEEGF